MSLPFMYIIIYIRIYHDNKSAFSVCKNCIVKHLDEHNTCPKCNEVIHQSHPKDHIRFDRTLQSIVYKVIFWISKMFKLSIRYPEILDGMKS